MQKSKKMPFLFCIAFGFHYLCRRHHIHMGRNKFSQKELEEIGKLLRQKNAVNRGKQKLIRHQLRVDYEFNISDFNEPGKAFGEDELRDAVKRGAIQVLDDATIAAMKEKRARDKARDEAARAKEAVEAGEQTDWQEALRQWNEWEGGNNT
jgi:hypothetical protein